MHIYKITHQESDRVYIGQTKNTVVKRWKEHVREAQRGCNYHIHSALRKYGADAFSVKTMGSFTSWEAIDLAEKFWIAYYNSCHGPGFNETTGGRVTWDLSQSARDKISRIHKGKPKSLEQRRKMSLAAKNRTSPAQRERWGQLQKGHKQTQEHKDKISAGLKRAYAEGRR